MAFFTRILNFKQGFLSRLRDKRTQPRYTVGAAFPLKATIILSGDNAGSKKGSSGSGLSWSGRAGNLSVNGMSVLLPPAALTARGEETSLRLTLDDHEIDLSCSVAHFRVFATHSVCGVKLNFDDFNVQKAYHQIVEAVRIGTSFEPAQATKPADGTLRQQWRSVSRSTLSEWRNATTHKIERFELSVGEHRLAGQVSPPSVKITGRSANSKSPVAEETALEVRDFFRWIASNFPPKTVPADLRDLINRLTSSKLLVNGGWSAPPRMR